MLGAKGGDGLEIRFSGPVHASTIHRGVIDIWVVEGAGGRSGYVYNLDGDLLGLPGKGMTSCLRYRQTSCESLQCGDRVIITLRCAFILDRCCQPVDGVHVGGRVPLLPEYHHLHRECGPQDCPHPPHRPGPWTSGAGIPGSTFESWFYVR